MSTIVASPIDKMYEVGLSQTSWKVNMQASVDSLLENIGMRHIDAVPTKFSQSGFLAACKHWEELQMKVMGIQGFLFNTGAAICNCANHKGDLLRHIELAISFAKQSSADYLILGAPAARAASCSKSSFISAVNEAATTSARTGVKLLIENLPFSFNDMHLASIVEIGAMRKHLSPEVGFCLDSGNLASWKQIHSTEFLLEELEALQVIDHLQINFDMPNFSLFDALPFIKAANPIDKPIVLEFPEFQSVEILERKLLEATASLNSIK